MLNADVANPTDIIKSGLCSAQSLLDGWSKDKDRSVIFSQKFDLSSIAEQACIAWRCGGSKNKTACLNAILEKRAATCPVPTPEDKGVFWFSDCEENTCLKCGQCRSFRREKILLDTTGPEVRVTSPKLLLNPPEAITDMVFHFGVPRRSIVPVHFFLCAPGLPDLEVDLGRQVAVTDVGLLGYHVRYQFVPSELTTIYGSNDAPSARTRAWTKLTDIDEWVGGYANCNPKRSSFDPVLDPKPFRYYRLAIPCTEAKILAIENLLFSTFAA